VSVFHGFLVSLDVFCTTFDTLGAITFPTAQAEFATTVPISFHSHPIIPLFDSSTVPILKSKFTINNYLFIKIYIDIIT
jgi:hypothetical protein